MDSSYT